MQIRIAPSLGELEGHPNHTWGTTTYTPEYEPATHLPCVFFGVYGLPDFFALWRHKGERHILWAGSDIRHFTKGYWLDEIGKIRIAPGQLAPWIAENCVNWVENDVEALALGAYGIPSKVVPSFLGKIEDFPLAFAKQDKVRLYTSVSGNDFKLYGWDKIPELAKENRDIEFHLYGNTIEPPFQLAYRTNIILHGRVPKEQMNEETKRMTGALRLTEFDGFSEILAKSLLMGQWPVSLIPYSHTLLPEHIHMLKLVEGPNIKGRECLIKKLNKYPWNQK